MARARKGKTGTLHPRARRSDDDVIDVEAEPVIDAPPRDAPPPIVVNVKASPEQKQMTRGGGTLRINGVEVRAVIDDVREAVDVGRAIGDLLASVFRR